MGEKHFSFIGLFIIEVLVLSSCFPGRNLLAALKSKNNVSWREGKR